MQIREARIEDCQQLVEGMRVVVGEARWLATESSTPVEELLGRFRSAVESPEHILLVLEDDGKAIGCIGMHPTLAEGVLSLGMWILPGWRGRGWGRRMIEAALEARPEEIHKVELEVFEDNAAAIALYRSIGFEQEGLRREHYRRLDGSLRSAVIMARLF
jgi:[ribosomal protein S18]-alanine N-acetyltransferase